MTDKSLHRIAILSAVVIAASTTLLAQKEDQRPRRSKTNPQGLLAINLDYFELAAATGGDFYFWGPGEFAAANLEVPGRGEDLVLAYGETRGTPETFEIPVEAGARELFTFCGAQRKDLCVLVRPDGTTVDRDDEGVRHQDYRFMTIVFVENPAAGQWKVELTGAGIHAVTARIAPGSDAPSFDRFAFVEMRGRPGHQGWFDIERQLSIGEELPCQADVSGTKGDLSFTFVDRGGHPIGTPALESTDDGWFGRCVVPSVPFRVVASGTDRLGVPFHRTTSHLTYPVD